jgi:predicted nucleotidyltransferase
MMSLSESLANELRMPWFLACLKMRDNIYRAAVWISPRGTAVQEVSDVDVIAEFSPGRRLSLLDMVGIENRLAEVLGVRVDLSPAKGLKEPVAAKASREAVLAF